MNIIDIPKKKKKLKKIIYPIKIPNNLIGKKDIILNVNKINKKNIDNFEIPNNLFIHKICRTKTKNKLLESLNEYLMKKFGSDFFKNKKLLETKTKLGLIGLK